MQVSARFSGRGHVHCRAAAGRLRTTARASAARNSEPVTQMRPSGAVRLLARSRASAGSAAMWADPAAQHQHGGRDRLGRQGPRVLDVLRRDDLVEQRQERLELALQVLVAGGAEDQRPPTGGEAGAERVGQGLGRGAVVRAVDDQERPMAEDLDPGRPLQRREAAGHVVAVRPPGAAATSARTSKPASATAALWAWCGPRSGSANVPQSVRQVRTATRNGVGRVTGRSGGIASNSKSVPSSWRRQRRCAATRRMAAAPRRPAPR